VGCDDVDERECMNEGKEKRCGFSHIFIYLAEILLSIYTFIDCVRLISLGFIDGWTRGWLENIAHIPSMLFGPFGDVTRALILDVVLVMVQSRHNVLFVT